MSEFSNFTGSGALAGSGALQTTLPSSWYLQENIFELEREHIFFKEWICVGREEQIAEPGDHQVLDVYGESILLVRNDEATATVRLRDHGRDLVSGRQRRQ